MYVIFTMHDFRLCAHPFHYFIFHNFIKVYFGWIFGAVAYREDISILYTLYIIYIIIYIIYRNLRFIISENAYEIMK